MKLLTNLNEEQFNSLDEGLQENYAKTDDGFMLTIEGMTHEDVSGLKSALEKERARRKALETDVAKARDATSDAERYKTRFHAAKRDAEINAAVAMQAGNTETLAPLLREHVKVVENDKGHIEYQVHKNGAALLKEDGTPMSIEEYVKSLKSEPAWKGSFRGTNGSGGNSFEADGTGTVMTSAPSGRRSQMSVVEKVDFINEHGQKQFDRLPL
jgi:hypothetical protein